MNELPPCPDTPFRPSRRKFFHHASLAAAAALPLPRIGSVSWPNRSPAPFPAPDDSRQAVVPAADFQIEIGELEWELSPGKKVRTTGYNGRIPGNILRVAEGKPVNIDILNRLHRPEIVHWHGQWIAPEVDGAMEEGAPMIAPGAGTRISFVPRPSGLHWYHTHVAANRDLNRALYSGQFGVFLVEPASNPGRYDREHFLVLHDWEPYFTTSDDGSQAVRYVAGSVNGRTLGHDEPIRVRQGERSLFHILNASATEAHWLALPGHKFQVIALDGRPVPTQAEIATLRLGPAERLSAVVAMDAPGVWIMGEPRSGFRQAGMGTVVEYAGRSEKPSWSDPPELNWSYAAFSDPSPAARKPDVTIPMVFTSRFQGHGALDRWMINGRSFPGTETIRLREGLRHRLIFDNRSMDDHPVHLHRHAFELVSVNGAAMSGVFKDVVIVEARTKVEADLVATNPGKTLFHCHQQDHMDLGFMTLFDYL